MIGSFLILALTSFVGISCAVPLVGHQQRSTNDVNESISWFPVDYYASDTTSIGLSFSQFKGDANIAVNGYSFVESNGGTYLYGIDAEGITFIYGGEIVFAMSYSNVCAYLDDYFGGFVVSYNNSLTSISITPYWRSYSFTNGYNTSFWGFIHEKTSFAFASATINSGLDSINLNDADEFSFDDNVNFYSHAFHPFLYGGSVSITINIASGYTLDDIELLFCMGVREKSNEYQDGYNAGYSDGYSTGNTQGYNDGHSAGYGEGYNAGLSTGYNNGYNEGYAYGVSLGGNATFVGLFGAIADTPIIMLRSLFNFDLFGMNVFIVIMSLLTGIIVIYVIKKVWK